MFTSISTGWATLDNLIGIGGYPERRLTHIHGPADQVLKLTRDWGSTVVVDSLDALAGFTIKGQPERLVVDATRLQGLETWPVYYGTLLPLRQELPCTVLWVTAGAPEMLPLALKFTASLRLACEDNQLVIIKNMVGTSRGSMPFPS